MNAEIVIFSGSAHPQIANDICAHLSVPRSPVRTTRFANDCLEVQLQANCRERDVYLIQPLVPPVQENLVELLLMADAARGASAARVTAVMSHYAYARSDKKDEPRISIGGRLVADLLVTAGINRVLTLTLHSPEVHGFFSVPVDHLHAQRELAAHFRSRDLSRAVVLSPDLGYAKSASHFAQRLGVPVAAGAKERFSDEKVSFSSIIGEVADRDVIVLDDEIARGTTVMELLTVLRAQDPRSISIACTHGLFADGALEKLAAAEDVTEIVCTNSVPVPVPHPKLTVLSVAPALAEAIRRTHDGQSVSVLFGSGNPLSRTVRCDSPSSVPVRPGCAGQAVEHEQDDPAHDRDEADEPPEPAAVGVVQSPDLQADGHDGDQGFDDVRQGGDLGRGGDDVDDDGDDEGEQGEPPERGSRGAPAKGEDVLERLRDRLAEADRAALQVTPLRTRLPAAAALRVWLVRRLAIPALVTALRIRAVWTAHV